MGRIAFVFSGQGAQRSGMASELYREYASIIRLFDEAEKVMPGITKLCFEGTPEELQDTKNTQPAMYLADMASAIALRDEGIVPDGVAGFSLGELPALSYAGVMSEVEGFSIVCRRAAAMAKAVASSPACMIAVMKLDDEIVCELCRSFSSAYPANYNAPGQLVVSCGASEKDDFIRAVTSAGGRAIPLAVSGGFHSPFMNAAAEEFGSFLEGVKLEKPRLPVYSNVTAELYSGDVRGALTRQINSPVLWRQLIERMVDDGYDTFVEAGVGGTLVKLIAKIRPGVATYTAETPDEVRRVVAKLSAVASEVRYEGK
ncbi:MAG TPA: ACP S-malonyltransferase [Bacillota bacterium]|nr:ACP S-malonyltransferase [Bacillota bacterium]